MVGTSTHVRLIWADPRGTPIGRSGMAMIALKRLAQRGIPIYTRGSGAPGWQSIEATKGSAGYLTGEQGG